MMHVPPWARWPTAGTATALVGIRPTKAMTAAVTGSGGWWGPVQGLWQISAMSSAEICQDWPDLADVGRHLDA